MVLLSLITVLAGCGPESTIGSSSSGQTEQESTQSSSPTAPQDAENNGNSSNNNQSQSGNQVEKPQSNSTEENMDTTTIQATITMSNGGIIVLELYPEIAPESVRNFVYLARDGFYDGLKFHRIIKGFMIQGGCPDGNGTGGPGYSIKGEFELNGFTNDLEHTRGVLSMARSQNPNSAGSQFFIMHADAPHLDGSYAAFGRVIEGMEIVDELAETPVYDTNGSVRPENMPVIKSIVIDSDIELPQPEMLPR